MPGIRFFSTLLRPVWFGNAISGFATPDMSAGGHFEGIVTGDVTINNPIHIPSPGNEIVFYLVQDANGGHKVTWGSQYSSPSGRLPQINKRPNQGSIVRFRNTSSGGTPNWAYVGGVLDEFYEPLSLGTNVNAVGGIDVPGAYLEGRDYLYVSLAGGLSAGAALGQWSLIASFPTIRPHLVRQITIGSVWLAFELDGTILIASPAGMASGDQINLDGVRVRL